MRGLRCRPKSYEGWFYEGSVSLLPTLLSPSVGYDLSFDDDPKHVMIPSRRRPGRVDEIHGGISLGAPVKGIWCRYKLLKQVCKQLKKRERRTEIAPNMYSVVLEWSE